MRRVLRIGVPGGADVATIVFCQMWYLALVNGLGSLAAAAHGVAIRIESIAYLPGTAFQVAAGTLAGQHLGAGDRKAANHSVVVATIIGLIVISMGGVVLYAAATPLAQLFLRPEEYEVARAAAPLLRTVALVMPALALMMILTGAARRRRHALAAGVHADRVCRRAHSHDVLVDGLVDAGRAGRVVRDGGRYHRALPAGHVPLLARRLDAD